MSRYRRYGRRVSPGEAAIAAVIGLALAGTAHGTAAHTPHAGGKAAQAAIAFAEAREGDPYCWGGTGPSCYDCSGLVMMAYRAAGVGLPRTSEEQWADGHKVARPRPGDLVFFAGSDGTMTAPGHVGIVTGPGQMIDAPYTGADVRSESYAGAADLVGFTRPSAGVG
jgi:cell wall-associated NlpC family hydrolase